MQPTGAPQALWAPRQQRYTPHLQRAARRPHRPDRTQREASVAVPQGPV